MAVGRLPALEQPGGDIERDGVDIPQQVRASLGDSAEHGIGETGELRPAAHTAHRPDRQVDSGVRRSAEADELRRAGEQNGPNCAFPRKRPLEERAKHVLQLPLPSQHGRGEGTGEGAVTRIECGEPWVPPEVRQHLFERAPVQQHPADQPVRQIACCYAGRRTAVGLRGHALPVRRLTLGP